MVIAICYKTKVPEIYNKGTKWEKAVDTFLAYYYMGTLEQAKEIVRKLNEEKPEKLFNGLPADCENRTYFVEEQKEMGAY